jgi:hypothetical protein
MSAQAAGPYLSSGKPVTATALPIKRTRNFWHVIWRRMRDAFSRAMQRNMTLLRSVGLNILTFVRQPNHEAPKMLYTSSRRIALARCAVHILPALVSICLVAINLTGYFIGPDLDGERGKNGLKLSVLQIVAKLQV